MPYADHDLLRAKARERSRRAREQTRATLRHGNYVSTPGKRAATQRASIEKGAAAGGRAAAMKVYTPAAITLPKINALTLEEIEAKYGK